MTSARGVVERDARADPLELELDAHELHVESRVEVMSAWLARPPLATGANFLEVTRPSSSRSTMCGRPLR
eukprot:1608215-Pyramimonas_sp.AAC.1